MKWRRVVLLILWILLLIGISFYGGAISYGFFWGVTLIPVLSFLYLFCVFIQFRIYQEIDSRMIVSKQPMPYFFVLQNETFFAFAGLSVRLFSDFSYVTDMTDDEEYELLPGDRYTYHTSLICKYRGEYEVGVKEITITDFFRLFRLRYKNPGTIKALVNPCVIHKKDLKSLQDMLHISANEVFTNQMIADVVTRDYIPGDALKRIHWKASAREQKLKTRNMLGEREQEVRLMYDTRRYSGKEEEYLPLENQILELVLALGVFLAEKNIKYTAVWGQNGIQRFTVEGLGQFEPFYRRTSGVMFEEQENVEGLLQQFADGDFRFGVQTLMLVVHAPSEKMMAILQMLATEGLYIVLYIVTDQNTEAYIKQGNDRLKIIAIPVEGNLEELL